ncbi:MAG: hypothetical protein WCV79_00915 [Candidatus Paceibacterota bacterium]|jgi:hypothetical protein
MDTSQIKNKKNNGERGLVKMIVLIVIALIILGYFGFNLREIVSSPTVHDNLIYFKEVVINVWNSYLKTPVMFLVDAFIKFVWDPFLKTK